MDRARLWSKRALGLNLDSYTYYYVIFNKLLAILNPPFFVQKMGIKNNTCTVIF